MVFAGHVGECHRIPLKTVLKKFDGNWILVLLLASFAVAPLTYPGFLQALSGFAPVYALEDLVANRPLGFWGIAWPSPLQPAAEGPLPYLLASLILRLGAFPVEAMRWVWAIGFLLGALGAYAWLRGRWGRAGALLGAVAYTYVPYHLSATYARGAVGESLALGILPWLPWALERRGWKAVAALGVGLLLLAATAPALAVLVALPLAWLVGLRLEGSARWGGWVMLLAGAALGLGGWLSLAGGGARIPLYMLLSGRDPLANPWTLGLIPVAVFLGVLGMLLGGRFSLEREVWVWLATFVLGCLAAVLWPGGDGARWTSLSLVALAVPPLVAMGVAAWPILHRLEVGAGVMTLVILAATPLLMPVFTRLDPGPEPLAVWEGPEGARLALLKSEVTGDPAGPEGAILDLRWQAWGQPVGDYTVFVHLVDGSGTIVAQRDAQPQDGERPTDGWRSGEIVPDTYVLRATADGLEGPFRIALGWYRPEARERLPLLRAGLPAEADHRVWIHVP